MPKAPVDTLTLTPESFEVQIHCEITPDPKSKEPLTQEFFERRLSALNESVQQFSQKPICLATRGRGNFDDDHWVEEMTSTGSVGIEKVTPDSLSLSLGAKVNSDFCSLTPGQGQCGVFQVLCGGTHDGSPVRQRVHFSH